MKKIIARYSYQTVTLTLLLGLLTWGFSLLFPKVRLTPAYPYALGFLFVLFWLSFFAVAKSMEKKISRFANTFMIANFLKLVLFSIFLLAYGSFHKSDASAFIVTFFVYYIFYTVLEVYGLKTLNAVFRKQK